MGQSDSGDSAVTAAARGEPRLALLRDTPLFAGADAAIVMAIAEEMQFVALPGGRVLFEEGEPGDALFYVVRGCLGIFERRAGGYTLLNEVAAGETVGELSLVVGRQRSATVAALRDSELFRLPRAAFEAMVREQPQAIAHLLRFILGRMDRIIRHEIMPHPPRSFVLVPVTDGVPVARLAVNLVAALGRSGGNAQLLTADSAGRPTEWFHDIERQSSHVVYLADASATPWTQLAMRQADRVLLVARAGAAPPPNWPASPLVAVAAATPFTPRRDLVMVHEHDSFAPGGTAAWLAGDVHANHYHLRLAVTADFDRVARAMTDRAVGAVFAGGGARGFAHLGVIKALREAGVPIDRVGGTSMGAIVGAGVAAGWDDQRMRDIFRAGFVDNNPLSDYTIPFISLFSGRKVSRLLQRAYGFVEIEDLPLPFFCVSANLTAGQTEIIDRGMLWQALRASVSLPGILPPVISREQVLVDGGVIDNLPVEIMRLRGAGPVLGVDIETAGAIAAGADVGARWSAWEFFRRLLWRRDQTLPLPSIVKILLRSALVSSEAASARHRAAADLVFRPPTAQIDLLDWQSFDRVVDIGYRHARQVLDRMKDQPIARRIFIG